MSDDKFSCSLHENVILVKFKATFFKLQLSDFCLVGEFLFFSPMAAISCNAKLQRGCLSALINGTEIELLDRDRCATLSVIENYFSSNCHEL